MRRPDPALAAVLAAVVLLGSASALATPLAADMDLTVDERGHLAYVQSLAERGEAPEEIGAGPRTDSVSTEQRTADLGSGVGAQLSPDTQVLPLWTEASERRWRAEETQLGPGARRDGGGPNDLGYMPPGYYAAMVVPYELAGGTWFDRGLAIRLASTLLIAGAAALAWWLALICGLGRTGALVAAGVVGLNPHAIALAGVVNPDAAVQPLWTGALVAGALLIVRGLSAPRLIGLGLTVLALPLVKPVGIAMLPAALLALGLALRPHLSRRAGVAVAAGTIAAFAGLALLATRRLERPIVSGSESLADLPQYFGQFYLPIVPRLGEYGWDVTRVLAVARHVPGSLAPAALTLLTIAGAAWLLFRRPAVPRGLVAFLALAALALLGGLHWYDYKAAIEHRTGFNQPRYFLPFVPLAGLVLGAAAERLPERWRGPAVAATLALCAGSSAAWVLERAEVGYA